ncbi:hypothetical protein CYMTET_32435 [Cymbomonas tetramitiformis]|uniref:DUF659 domain-containing protein n=1 Tax=Cymbomonas tetramitiformis TaxID=36881 RepID=A0AAE0FEV5_9CHLO|nr:hypothetical protein CYMTET_32435 [Cymbomonas tetramitiformis]
MTDIGEEHPPSPSPSAPDDDHDQLEEEECGGTASARPAPRERTVNLKTDFLWVFVRVAKPRRDSLGNKQLYPAGKRGSPKEEATCLFCDKTFNGTPDRICCHISGTKAAGIAACPGVRQRQDEEDSSFQERKTQFTNAKAQCLQYKKERDEEREKVRERTLLNNATSTDAAVVAGSRKRGRQLAIGPLLINSKQQLADEELAMALYETDTPFHILDHPAMKTALARVAAVGAGYTAPNFRTVGSTMLEKAYDKVQAEIAEQRAPLRKFGTTLVSDGATDGNRRPILNLLNVSPALVEFIKAHNCEGKVKDKQFIADFICDYIESLDDPYSVVQVLMDNATRGSWPLIEKRCPWVSVGPCETHVSDLELEDFVKKVPFFKKIVHEVNVVRKFVRNHSHVLSTFKELSQRMLTLPGATRFATVFIGLENMAKNLDAVQKTLADTHVREYVRRNRNQRATPESPTLMAQYEEVKAIADDMLLPLGIKLVSDCMRPVVSLLRFSDSDAPTASKIQYMKFQVQEQLKAIRVLPGNIPWEDGEHCWSDIQQELISIHRYRWDYGFTCVQGTGYLLDPEYIDMDQHDDPEIMEAFRTFVEKTFNDGISPPADATEEEKEAYKKHCEVQLEKRAAAEVELMTYKNKLGVFARPVTWLNAKR